MKIRRCSFIIALIVLVMAIASTTAFAANGSITINHNNGGSVNAVNATNTSGNMILTTADETIGIIITPNAGYVIYGAYLNEVSMGINNSSEAKTVYISPRGENVVLRITFVQADAAGITTDPPQTTPDTTTPPVNEQPPQKPVQQPQQPTQTPTDPAKPPAPPQVTPKPEVPSGSVQTPVEEDPVTTEGSETGTVDIQPSPEKTEDVSETKPDESDIFGAAEGTKHDHTEDFGDGVGTMIDPAGSTLNWAKIATIGGVILAIIVSTAFVLVYIRKRSK